MSKFFKALGASLAVSVALAVSPAASAQTAPAAAAPEFNLGQIFGINPDQAWLNRNGMLQSIHQSAIPQLIPLLEATVDNLMSVFYPGLVDRKTAEIREAEEARNRAAAEQLAREKAESEAAARRAEEERRRNEFNRGSCPLDAAVCVDIDGNRSWLQDEHGNVTHVANWISSGARTPELATPKGTFRVEYKVKDEVSRQFGNAPMPYSIYFTLNGHAFHQGDPALDSHGCVHLAHQDAVAYWNALKVGDKVYIY